MQQTGIVRSVEKSMRVRARNARRRQGGAVMIVTLFFLLIVFMLVATMMSAATGAHRLAVRGAQKVQADTLAEAAVHAHYDAIKKALATTNETYPLTRPAMTLYSTVNGVTTPDGSYSSRVIGTPEKLSLPLLNSSNINVGIKLVWTFVIEGEGVSSSGIHSKVRASFTAIQLRANVGVTTSPAFAADAAVQSNSKVEMVTNGGLKFTAQGNDSANVLANDGAVWQVATGKKEDIRNQNAISVDGQLMVPRSPDPAYAETIGVNGMGNSNGTTNYQTRPLTGSTPVPPNSIYGIAGSRNFADDNQVAAWKQDWIAKASTGTSYSGTVTPQALPLNVLGERRITAPAIINGDLLVNSGSVYLQPNVDSKKPRVIYVTGNISNAAKLYNRGVLLICAGRYNDSRTSSLYSVQSQLSLFTSQSSLYSAAGLVSLSKSADAIALNASSNSLAGLVYATLGGIRVKGESGLHGALIAGGEGANGGVSLKPSGNPFVVTYEPDALNRDDFPMSPGDINVGAVLGLNPTRLKNWMEVN